MTEEGLKQAVAVLDEHYPGWWERIDLDTLEMASLDDCILGQLNGGFVNGGWAQKIEDLFGGSPVDPGLPAGHPALLFASHDEEWREVILARRAS